MSKKISRSIAFFHSMKMWPPVLVPYLVVLLFASNEVVLLTTHFHFSFWALPGNIAILLLVAFIAHFIISLLIPQRYLAGIITGYALFISVYYFDLYIWIYNGIPWVSQHITQAYNVFLLALFIISGIFLWLALRPLKEKLRYFNSYLMVILTLFIFIEIGKAALFKPFKLEFTDQPSTVQLMASSKPSTYPDIYYIIFDSYTSSRSLKQFWGYQNTLDTLLQHHGFYVAAKSNANYNSTNYSISSCLNMSYLNVSTRQESSRVPEPNYNTISDDNLLTNFLIRHAYEIKAFSMFDFMGTKNYYGIDYSNPGFFDRTICQLIEVKLGIKKMTPLFPEKQKNAEIIDSLVTISKQKRQQPQFVFAHINLPHPPFFYNETGQEMDNAYAFMDDSKEKYLSQLKYVNTLISDMLQQMLPQCKDNAIIIIQGDHGYRQITDESNANRNAEGLSILNAYYFPDKDYHLLYNSISPVNSFRVILNKEFGTRLPLLPDTSYSLHE